MTTRGSSKLSEPSTWAVFAAGVVVGALLFGSRGHQNSDTGEAGGPQAVAQRRADDSSAAQFAALPAEKQQFVDNEYQLATSLYKAQRYEQCLYELAKLHVVLPAGYKDSKDYVSYAAKALEVTKERAAASEHNAELERQRVEIHDLESKLMDAVAERRYGDARTLLLALIEKDPDNATAARLKAQIPAR